MGFLFSDEGQHLTFMSTLWLQKTSIAFEITRPMVNVLQENILCNVTPKFHLSLYIFNDATSFAHSNYRLRLISEFISGIILDLLNQLTNEF